MALPLPKVIADVGPGGPLVTSMGGMNSLANDMLLQQINRVKAKYAPLTVQADAASKLAYAKLMGPQYLAKMMSNPDIVANLTEDQKREILDIIRGPGTGGTNGTSNPPPPIENNNPLNQLPVTQPQPNNNGTFSSWLTNGIKNVFGGGAPVAAASAQPSQNALAFNQVPGNPNSSPNNNEMLAAGDAWKRSPEGLAQIKNQGYYDIPGDERLLQWYRGTQQGQQGQQGRGPDSGYSYNADGTNTVATPQEIAMAGNGSQPTYAENAANFAGIKEEGKEAGKIRAQAIDELDQQYQQAIQSEVPLTHMNEIVTNPAFSNMRNFPWFQGMQLNMKAKIGTPEEQKLIGDFQTTAQNAVAQTVMGFKGRILDKEVDMANKMKINPEDTFQVILGKLPSIEAFNEFTKQRSRIASQLMAKKHIGRGEALEQADKMIDSKAIRGKIDKLLDYPVTVTNKKTGQSRTIPVSEARKLGVPNV